VANQFHSVRPNFGPCWFGLLSNQHTLPPFVAFSRIVRGSVSCESLLSSCNSGLIKHTQTLAAEGCSESSRHNILIQSLHEETEFRLSLRTAAVAQEVKWLSTGLDGWCWIWFGDRNSLCSGVHAASCPNVILLLLCSMGRNMNIITHLRVVPRSRECVELCLSWRGT
jgi:hypothetical protein